jgi:chromosome partitioning protein
MLIGIASHKGGVGKTTTAIHLAAILAKRGPTLLIDGDANRSALAYSKRGGELPFKVVDERASAKYVRDFDHIVIDTAAHPSKSELAAMVESCDRLVIVCEPEIMSLDVLPEMLSDLGKLGSQAHGVLLCQVSPRSDAAEARGAIEGLNVQTFKRHIRSYAAYKLAATLGTTVDQVGNEYAGEAWADYVALGKELAI